MKKLEELSDEAIIFDDCESAIVGSDDNGYAVYSHEKLIEIFESKGMT